MFGRRALHDHLRFGFGWPGLASSRNASAMSVVGPWIWLQATSASVIAMFRDAATRQADKTPKTSETPPIAQCSRSFAAANA